MLRLALVGAGRMGSTHARALAGSAEVELAVVVEPSDDAAAALPLPRVGSLDELPAVGVDGAIVAVPTRLHAPVVTQLLEAGVPVLCEKPCGLSSDETRQLAALARTAGLVLQVGYWRRFVPALRELRGRLRGLGDLELIHCAQWDELPPPAAFRDPASSGGIIVDMGVHEFDQLRWLTGREILDVRGATSTVAFDEPVAGDPDSVALTIELDGGAIALVTLLRRYPPGDLCRVELVATLGAERIDFVAPGDGDATFLGALRAQAHDFATAVSGGDSSGANAEDAAAALEIAERTRGALGL
jgi:myo-inositol 2-dehydrogenase / D-chiro-inositol 1-dehydrogenase